MKILVGVSGSVAAIKLPLLVTSLRATGGDSIEIKVVFTQRGMQFLTPDDIETISKSTTGIYSDEAEWVKWEKKGDPILHIELRKWADVLLVCPLSANSLAKLAAGLCDNLLTSIIRAWPTKDAEKQLIVCPAMNTFMWDNCLTSAHLDTLRRVYAARIVMPKEMHVLACGDVGAGALAGIEEIVNTVFAIRL